MSKILVLGDIHGRTCWKSIIEKENPDKIIFLGDYVSTHDDVSEEEQIENLYNILNYKEENPDKVILLRGNHDIQHLGYPWAECSGYFPKVAEAMQENKEHFISNTSWIYKLDNIIFSHAGISETWLNNSGLTMDTINNQKPSELFGFIPDSYFDWTGDSITQPLTWIRPVSLVKSAYSDYTQVVGHTPVTEIVNVMSRSKIIKARKRKPLDYTKSDGIWLCDALPRQYLIIENNEFIVKNND